MRAAAVLLGAGSGERLADGSGAKALAELAGRPLLAYAVDAVDGCPSLEGFVVAAPGGRESDLEAIARRSPKLVGVTAGGPTRQASVRRCLEALPEGFDAVVCHDVARPLAGAALFSAVIHALAGADGAVPAVPVVDTVKRVEGTEVAETLARAGLVVAQTPQAFRRAALEAAHATAARDGWEANDDATLLERAGYRVVTVRGDPANLKVTVAEDLARAEALLQEAAGRG